MRSAEPPVITAVAPGSPAERAGLQVGDHILLVNGKDAREPGLLRPRAAGLTFVFRVRRGDALHEITVVSAPNPAAAQR
jgi:S1-C subfamily serine protease